MTAATQKGPRILFASAEAVPFAKTGGLGDVAGTLPTALSQAGARVSVCMPLYSSIDVAYQEQMKTLAEFDVPMPWGPVPCTCKSLKLGEVTYLFIGNDDFFARDSGLYGYGDDGGRFAFFSRAVCETICLVRQARCDVVHCHDWQTALIPLYLHEFYQDKPCCRNLKTVFTIHNAMFQGKYPEDSYDSLIGVNTGQAISASTTDCGSVNYMKAALSYADKLSTVSSTYVQELKTPRFGEGLDPFFRRRGQDFVGILNGIDRAIWNPATDALIPFTYDQDNLAGKAACKKALQEELGLWVDPSRPLVSMVSRLTDQKGVGMVCESVGRLMACGIQLAILGTGDPRYENELRDLSMHYPGQMSVALRFDNALSHRMYAGSDMLLMPSDFEPCGLSQMIAMRYGTLPIVRETGGLKDSVAPYNRYTGTGTGFSFANMDSSEMADILLYGADIFMNEKEAWSSLQAQAMQADFSWSRAAKDYLALYEQLLG